VIGRRERAPQRWRVKVEEIPKKLEEEFEKRVS
jgi:hypothetical protein